jgi:hypothetical protein
MRGRRSEAESFSSEYGLKMFDNVLKAWDSSTTLVFFAFFVPGFISTQVWRVLFPFQKDNLRTQVPEILGFGAANYGITYPILHFIPKNSPWAFVLFYTATFLLPIGTPYAVYWVRYRFQFGALNPTPKPWDYVFSQGKLLWVAIELSSGELIGGKFGTNSFASSFPNDEQIYLEEAWEVDKDLSFIKRLERSAGIIINGSDVKRMLFFK